MTSTLTLPQNDLHDVHQTLLRFAPDAVLVGGAVRDLILQRPVNDLDYVVHGNGLHIGKKLADTLGAAYYPLDESRQIARVVWKRESTSLVIDISSLLDMPLEEDIRRRDFTINAIAMLPDGKIFDLLGGVRDLSERKLRLCTPHSLLNDPIRTMRAVRFLYKFQLTPAPGLEQQIQQAAPLLKQISPERQRDEFVKILALPEPDLALARMVDWRIAHVFMPELVALQGVAQSAPHIFDVYQHTLQVVRWVSRLDAWLLHDSRPQNTSEELIQQRLANYKTELRAYLQEQIIAERPRWLWLRFAAIAHDWGKPESISQDDGGKIHFFRHEKLSAEMAAAWMNRYNCARHEIKFVQHICAAHMRPMNFLPPNSPPSKRAVFRFHRDLGDVAPAVVILFLADFMGARGQDVQQEELAIALDTAETLLKPWASEQQEPTVPPPLLNGKELMQIFGLRPGPEIGKLLAALQEAQAVGQIQNREQAIAYIANLLSKESHD